MRQQLIAKEHFRRGNAETYINHLFVGDLYDPAERVQAELPLKLA